MIQKLLKPFIYPYEVSFWVEGSAENNFAILKEFIKFNSFKLISEKEGEIQFSIRPSKIKCGHLLKTICTFTRYSPTRCNMSFHFTMFRNWMLAYLSIFFVLILIGVFFKGKLWGLLLIPAMYFGVNFANFCGSILRPWIKLRAFFKEKLFQDQS